MSWIPEWIAHPIDSITEAWTGTPNFSESSARYSQQQVIYAAQLKRRLDDGQISDQFYQNQLGLLRDSLQDPSDAAWSAFTAEFEAQAVNLPANVTNALGDAATWAGLTVGTTAGNLTSGLLAGIFGKWRTVIFIGLVLFVLWWAFTRGPLKGAKVSVIPIPA